jgi:tRNA A37 threonylcarbamoyladenosine synthetase subunit TsaC/SUA5/YrdC
MESKTIPAPNQLPNVKIDALRVFNVLKSGGVAILPSEVGYAIFASSADAIERAFTAKQRKAGHSVGIIGTYDLHRGLHVLDDERFGMTRVLTQDLDMPLIIVAPYRADHPILKNTTPQTLAKASKNGTIAMYVGGGSLLTELCKLNEAAGQLVVGSSANVSGKGQKFRVQDIEQDVLDVADIIIDYGLQRYHIYGQASTSMDFENMRVIRKGSCYELLQERMNKFWGVDLEKDETR